MRLCKRGKVGEGSRSLCNRVGCSIVSCSEVKLLAGQRISSDKAHWSDLYGMIYTVQFPIVDVLRIYHLLEMMLSLAMEMLKFPLVMYVAVTAVLSCLKTAPQVC